MSVSAGHLPQEGCLTELHANCIALHGDGSCFYWSVSTGMGHYDATSFDLHGLGADASLIYIPKRRRYAPL